MEPFTCGREKRPCPSPGICRNWNTQPRGSERAGAPDEVFRSPLDLCNSILKLAKEARREGLEEKEETLGVPFSIWRSLFCPLPLMSSYSSPVPSAL